MLTSLDRKILDLLQNKFPISIHPYRQLADILGMDEAALLQRIQHLKDEGIIRRIGGIMDSRSLGFYSVLCASEVPEERIDQVAFRINAEPGVTHNYRRNHRLNLWFTLTAPTRDKAQLILQRLENELNIKIYTLPAEKVYKIKLSLPMQEDDYAD
ncbi:MAG TPA: AsnC family transcriptional regulator [Syntrophomonadaceae bacterium]|nr:Lrp/AsnC family transcriptional regulator [Syntrophomonadaceae bacterium]HOQ08803.1 AsnC family transcriptional regulator [Syntrophomonadaceae bacterium]HPU47777.1 AsnC family transcriptional regulator [Syntrophomonadaceae bacterium]